MKLKCLSFLIILVLSMSGAGCFLNNPFLVETYPGKSITTTTVPVSAPSVTISSNESGITYNSTFSIAVSFNRPVVGFSIDKVIVTNGSVNNLQEVSFSTNWQMEITPSATGTVTVNVPAACVKDSATGSLDNSASNIFSIMYDGTGPGVEMTSTDSGVTSNSPFPITVTFDESVIDFDLTDIAVLNGSAGNLVSITTDEIWSVDITPAGDGTVTIDIHSGSVQDKLSGLLDNTPAIQFVIEFDGTDPNVLISTTASDPTAVSPIPFTISFDEDVLGFSQTDITITNGSIVNIQENQANRIWAIDVMPDSDPILVSVDIPDSIAQDSAGNFNTVATQVSRTFNTTSLTVNVTSSEVSPTNTSPFAITITFSQQVQNFISGDIVVGNGSVSGFNTSDNITFTADITPSSDGVVTIDIPAAAAQDAGTGLIDNVMSSQYSIDFDGTLPSFLSVDDVGSGAYKAGDAITFNIDMGETGLDLYTDMTVLDSNFSASQELIDNGDNTYSYTTAVLDAGGNMQEGAITIQFTAFDSAGNTDSDSSLILTLDKTHPLFVDASIENSGWQDVVVNFDEPITLTNENGFSVYVDGSAVGITSVSGSGTATLTFAIDRAPLSFEIVTISYVFAAGDARDDIGNPLLGFSNQQVLVNTTWRHTIVIDGNNDFTGFETFTTSSTGTGYTGYVSWDDNYIYVGMEGPDVNANDPERWIIIYFDGTPGSTTGVTFKNQTPGLPFPAHWFYQWRADRNFTRLSAYNGSTFNDSGWGGADWNQNGSYFETRFSLSGLGNPSTLKFHMVMINEVIGGEWTWGAVPVDSFADSFDPDYAKYFEFDFSSTSKPRDYVSQ